MPVTEALPVVHHKLALERRLQLGDVLDGVEGVVQVFDGDPQVPRVVVTPHREASCLVVVPRLVAHIDRGLDVESAVRGLDESIELVRLLELRVALQQQCGVVLVGELVVVEGLEVAGQVDDALGIEELTDHVGRLHVPYRLQVVRHGPSVVSLVLLVVRALSVDLHDERLRAALARGESDGDAVEVLPLEDLHLGLQILLGQAEGLPALRHDEKLSPLRGHAGDGVRFLVEGYQLVLQVVQSHRV
mmetsp:Transcript_31686/g.61282  ORF Transcript_31686/g.61282 Transcript_31686/m.61282 type:complete len:246 (-) Transcript_31686:900-1637(-)